MKKIPRSTMAGAFPATNPMKPGAPTFKSKARVKALRKGKK